MLYIINCEAFIYHRALGADIYNIYYQYYTINRKTT